MSLPNHGANPNHLAKALGMTLPEHIDDFSVNTNPFGPPSSLSKMNLKDLLSDVSAYPDPHVSELTARLAKINNVPTSHLLVGNGAAELIFLIGSVFRQKKVRIIEPAFSEYRDACLAHDCQVESLVIRSTLEA